MEWPLNPKKIGSAETFHIANLFNLPRGGVEETNSAAGQVLAKLT